MIRFYSYMVKPLRDELGMTRESFAYILGCSVSTIRKYEVLEPKRMKSKIRTNMISQMTKNGLTTDDLVPPPADTSDSDAFIDMLTEDLTGGES